MFISYLNDRIWFMFFYAYRLILCRTYLCHLCSSCASEQSSVIKHYLRQFMKRNDTTIKNRVRRTECQTMINRNIRWIENKINNGRSFDSDLIFNEKLFLETDNGGNCPQTTTSNLTVQVRLVSNVIILDSC